MTSELHRYLQRIKAEVTELKGECDIHDLLNSDSKRKDLQNLEQVHS